ncbi:3-deoxy-8-phosphooctulonate synthase [Candidatus Methylomirabilis sp.]|uniref:3-deoxy-8-phosphooctulonate synthase n=1 Tax=Candidatus Methylomirabilis sp. TaxID=2032687 RepID=UPI002A5D0BAB|nr:3-deoxy-8-phosphooctulonate synthase [Candidatus Methylomirabilis sp.]
MTKQVRIGELTLGGGAPLLLVAGPCVIESEEHLLRTGEAIKVVCEACRVPLILKASYDKANRSSGHSFRGPGLEEGLRILERVKAKLGVPVISDVHDVNQVSAAAEVLDILQIPAFLCRQTDLLLAAARSGKPVNVKKGQFLSPWDAGHIVEKLRSAGSEAIVLTERGTSFGYNNLVVDIRSLPVMRSFGYPVLFDVTHSMQLPGGAGNASGGQPQFIPFIARAAVAAGVDGLFMEVHPDPANAPSDGPNMLRLDALPGLLSQLLEVQRAVAPYVNQPSVQTLKADR